MRHDLLNWIQGSKVTAHERHILNDGDALATRQIIRHQFKNGVINAFPHSRVQIRVPSLDAKSEASEEAHIEDVKEGKEPTTPEETAKAL